MGVCAKWSIDLKAIESSGEVECGCLGLGEQGAGLQMEALKPERITMPRAGPGTHGSMEGPGKFQECVHLGWGLARPGLGRG